MATQRVAQKRPLTANERAANARQDGESAYRAQKAVTDALNGTEQLRLNDLRTRRSVRQVITELNGPTPTEAAEQRYAKAFARYLRTGHMSTDMERRDMGEVTGSAGGYLVPKKFYQCMLTEAKTQPFPLLANALIVETPNFSGPINFPVLKDGSVTSGVVSENTQYGEQDFTLGNIAYSDCNCYVCGAMRVSIALSEDMDNGDLEAVVDDAWNLRTFAGVEIDATATVIAGCAATVTAGAGVLAYADLVSAFFAVSPLYRAGAVWVFSTAAMKALRNLKDSSTNRPVLLDTPVRTVNDSFGQTSLVPMLLGCPAFESNAFDNAVSTGKNVGAFGNFQRALPIRRGPATLQVLNERWIDYAQRGYVGRQYFDASQIGIAAAATVIQIQ